ncbi:MAG: DUF402 domain-containing protein [Candidatus Korarchaeota archaeon]
MKGSVRIRGIHTTALSTLLIKNGFFLSGMSQEMMVRFRSLPPSDRDFFLSHISDALPDATIIDSDSKDGFVIIGAPEVVDEIIRILQNMDWFFVNVYPVCLGDIYLGKVIGVQNNETLIDIGNGVVGILPKTIEGDSAVVTVTSVRNKQPLLVEGIEIRNKVAVLLPETKVLFSEHLDKSEILRLFGVTSAIDLKGHGIRWRSSAALLDNEKLVEMVQESLKEIEILERVASSGTPPLLLKRGERVAQVILCAESRRKMDQLRGEYFPTIPGHHWGKSLGKEISEIVDYAEYALSYGADKEALLNALKKFVFEAFEKNSRHKPVVIHHRYPDGTGFDISGKAHRIENGYCVISRKIECDGTYDGIGIEKKKGDIAETHVLLDAPSIVHMYYRNGDFIGAYINVNTPVETELDGFRYVDLIVDIAITEDSKKIVDHEKLEKYVRENIITPAREEAILGISTELFNYSSMILENKTKEFLAIARDIWKKFAKK